MYRWFFILFFLLSALHSQTIKEIRFDGLIHLSKETAKEITKLKKGEILNEKKINDAIINFYNQSYFNDIWVTEEGGIVTFYFVEKPVVSKVSIDGYELGEESEREAILRFKKGTIYDEKKIETVKRRIVEHIAQKGKIDTVVEAEVKPLENGSVEVVFVVNEGEDITITDLDFNGKNSFEKSEIETVLANREKDFMGWLWGRNNGEMKPSELYYDSMRVKDLYMRNGFLDTEVSKPFVRVNFTNYTAKMLYSIKEGRPYEVSDIEVIDTKDIISTKRYKRNMKLEVGDTFNIEKFRKDMEHIKKLISDEGYAYAEVQPDLQKNRESGEVKVILTVIPGEKVYVRNVIIGGNTRTLDRVVRRSIYMVPGKLYSLTDLKDSRSELQRTGYFESTTVEEKRVSRNEIDIVVKVVEAPTGSISVGGGYGSYEGVLLSASLQDRNLFGSGISGSMVIDNSSVNKRYSLTLTNPRLNDSVYSLSGNVFRSDYRYIDYSVEQVGYSLGVGRKFTRHLSASVAIGYIENLLKDVNITAKTNPDSIFYKDSYDKGYVALSAKYDNTDDYYTPRNGISITQTVEYAGYIGAVEDVKTISTFSVYKGLEDIIGYDFIVRYKARLNILFENGFVPVSERFYLGGVKSLRGFESYSLSPRDSDGYKIGGRKLFTNAFEVSVPIVPEAKLRGAFFIEYGTIGSDNFRDISRASGGFAVEWFSPMGPVQLIFANPINDKPEDKTTSFEFTIGQRF